MDLNETGQEVVGWIRLIQIALYWRALVGVVMNNRISIRGEEFGEQPSGFEGVFSKYLFTQLAMT
jgi:hypothetical protein